MTRTFQFGTQTWVICVEPFDTAYETIAHRRLETTTDHEVSITIAPNEDAEVAFNEMIRVLERTIGPCSGSCGSCAPDAAGDES